MTADLFGRTNESFPRLWIKPIFTAGASIKELASAAVASRTVIDVSSNPAIMSGSLDSHSKIAFTIPDRAARAADESQAFDIVQAELFEAMASLKREQIDFAFLLVRSAWEEYQASGALGALTAAKEEGVIRFIGLKASGNPMSALGFWQFHDAFEAISFPRSEGSDEHWTTLHDLADARRVGIASCDPFGHNLVESNIPESIACLKKGLEASNVIAPVSSPSAIQAWMEAGLTRHPSAAAAP